MTTVTVDGLRPAHPLIVVDRDVLRFAPDGTQPTPEQSAKIDAILTRPGVTVTPTGRTWVAHTDVALYTDRDQQHCWLIDRRYHRTHLTTTSDLRITRVVAQVDHHAPREPRRSVVHTFQTTPLVALNPNGMAVAIVMPFDPHQAPGHERARIGRQARPPTPATIEALNRDRQAALAVIARHGHAYTARCTTEPGEGVGVLARPLVDHPTVTAGSAAVLDDCGLIEQPESPDEWALTPAGRRACIAAGLDVHGHTP